MQTAYTIANISDFRNNVKSYFDLSSKNKSPLIITNRDEPIKIILDIDEYEDFLTSKNKNILNKIKKSKAEFKSGKVHTAEDIFAELSI